MSSDPHDWLQNLGIAIEVVFPALALIVTVLRVYSRLHTSNFGWDDGCIIVAMVLSLAMSIGSIFCIKYLYIGIHYWEVPPDANFEPGLIWTYAVGAIYNPILSMVKLSVLIFLLRLGGTKPGVHAVVWGTGIFNLANMIAIFFGVIFSCTPIEANWKGGGHCVDSLTFAISTGCFTIVTDLAAVALPFYIFLDLNIKKRTKWALMLVFLLGLLVTAISVVRLYFLWLHFVSHDPDINYSLGFEMSAIECNLAIMTASAPALWPLIRSWMPRLFSTLGVSNAYQQNEDIERTPNGSKRRAYTRASSAGGLHTNHTIGGSDFALKDIRGDRARGRVDIHSSQQGGDSDEEILTHAGIMRTTDYSVTRLDGSRANASRGGDPDGKRSSTGDSTLEAGEP